MTNSNMDEFDPENLDPSAPPVGAKDDVKSRIVEAWRSRPLFKLMVIMMVVGVAVAITVGVSSGPPVDKSKIAKAPSMNEPPGGQTSEFFKAQNDMANKQRADDALRNGTSMLPTPVGQVDLPEVDTGKKADPLKEYRAETDRLRDQMKAEQQQNAQQIQMMKVQMQQQQKPVQALPTEDPALAQAMQKQMSQLMDSWSPRHMNVVVGGGMADMKNDEALRQKAAAAGANSPNAGGGANSAQSNAAVPVKDIVSAGTVNYGQILVEANSDVPGPILAQVLSGPLAGGRAIGRFQVEGDYLVMEFNLINYKGKDYSVNILALDPDTTLGGMATEVDHRYFSRVLLPAAGSFMSTFGQDMGQAPQTTSLSNGTVIVQQTQQSTKQATYAGIGQAGQSIAGFLNQQAAQTKPLVRVAVGTPLGMFFLTGVKENGAPIAQQTAAGNSLFGGQAGGQFNPMMALGLGGNNGYNGYATANSGNAVPQNLYPAGFQPTSGIRSGTSGLGGTVVPSSQVGGLQIYGH